MALLVSFGILGTPRARIVRDTIRAWVAILRDLSGNPLTRLRVAWANARNKLVADNIPKNIRGLMSNIINILIRAGWDPRQFNVWNDDDGSTWAIVSVKASPDSVAAAIIKSYHRADLKRACGHHNGGGMQDGIDYHNTMNVLRAFTKKQYTRKCALGTVVAGATWAAKRIHGINGSVSPLCTRCGLGVEEDDLHQFWCCPANHDIDDVAVSSTRVLEQAALLQAGRFPCLWLRGILPASFTSIDPQFAPIEGLEVTYASPDKAAFGSGTYYGDASGGLHTSHTAIRRCGAGLAAIDEQGQLVYGASFNLPGAVQTVPRGEIFALVLLVRLALEHSNIYYVTDNKGLYDTYNSGPEAGDFTVNCDLYDEIFSSARRKALELSVRWMPSHLKEGDERPAGVSWADVKGNDHADKLARSAADKHQVPKQMSTDYLYYVSLVAKIQKGMAAIIVSLPDRKREDREATASSAVCATPRATIKRCLANTDHAIVHKGERISCKRCGSSFSKRDPNLKHWLQCKCAAKPSAPAGSTNLAPAEADAAPPSRSTTYPQRHPGLTHLSNKAIHHTHDMYIYRGLSYCNRCGYIATNQVRALSDQCVEPRRNGQNVLKHIREGKVPPSLKLGKWPDEL
jgi:hypothetical protein